MAILSLEHVTKKYGDFTVFNDLDLKINEGEVTLIIGPSGSGKSTLLRCLNRLEDIDEGEEHLPGNTARLRIIAG